MEAIRAKSMKILTEGEKTQAKNAERQAQFDQEKSRKDKINKAAQNYVNGQVADNIFEDKVKNFAEKNVQSYNYHIDLADFEDDLPGGVIDLPEDYEHPQRWNKEKQELEDTVYTLNQALRSKGLREFIQEILDEHYNGMTVRIYADDFQNEDGDPNKFNIKLYNPNGQAKTYKGSKQSRGKGSGKGSKGSKGGKGGKGTTITAGRTMEEYEAEQAKAQQDLNNLNK